MYEHANAYIKSLNEIYKLMNTIYLNKSKLKQKCNKYCKVIMLVSESCHCFSFEICKLDTGSMYIINVQ